jgi:hypothetical protein
MVDVSFSGDVVGSYAVVRVEAATRIFPRCWFNDGGKPVLRVKRRSRTLGLVQP